MLHWVSASKLPSSRVSCLPSSLSPSSVLPSRDSDKLVELHTLSAERVRREDASVGVRCQSPAKFFFIGRPGPERVRNGTGCLVAADPIIAVGSQPKDPRDNPYP